MQERVQVKASRVHDEIVESRSLIGDLIERRRHRFRVDDSHRLDEVLEVFGRLDLLVHLNRPRSIKIHLFVLLSIDNEENNKKFK